MKPGSGQMVPLPPEPSIDLRALAEQVPMYRQFWRQQGFDPAAGLHTAPIIGKRELREAGVQGRLDARFAGAALSGEHTGGSSGEPVEILIDAGTRRRRQWRFLKALMAAGYRPGQRLWIVSTHRSSKINRLARWTYVDLRESELALSHRFAQEKPQALYGPLRALLSMAQELPPASAHTHVPRVLVATAELLRREDQAALRQAFGREAADFYGMTEIGLFAYRLAGQPHYRLAAPDVLAEFLPVDSDPSLEKLVLTTLRPCAMPLVRYDTGDLVRRDKSVAGHPIVEFIGREIDGLLLPTGKRISPYRITLALETVPGIRRYQVVQREDLSVDVLLQTGVAAEAAAAYEAARRVIAQVLDDRLPVRGGPLPESGTTEKFRPVRSYAR